MEEPNLTVRRRQTEKTGLAGQLTNRQTKGI